MYKSESESELKTHQTRHNGPTIQHIHLPFSNRLGPEHQNRRLRHAMLVPLLLADMHVDPALLPEVRDQRVVRVDDHVAGVAGGGAGGGQVRLGLGSDADDGAGVRCDQAGGQGGEGFEVGHAEGAPVAAVDN